MDQDKDSMEKVKKKLKEGWIKSSMFIEALSLTEKNAKEALEEHIEKLKKEGNALVYKIDFKGVQKVDKPLQGVDVGYSSIVNLELLTENFDKLIHLAMTYGPTNIEVLEPLNLSIPAGEAQGIANTVADIIHTVARMRLGGIPVKYKNAEVKEEY